jgi:hypothetical protein
MPPFYNWAHILTSIFELEVNVTVVVSSFSICLKTKPIMNIVKEQNSNKKKLPNVIFFYVSDITS